jgi:CRP/FNR family transcriptional regulator, cyclic AMP receptor protein
VDTSQDRYREYMTVDSPLGELSPALRDHLLQDALEIDLPQGSVIYRDDDDPRCVLVVSGLVRVFLSAPDGRSTTVRYARSGEILGVPTLFGGPAPVSVQMVTDVKALMLDANAMRHLARTDPDVAWVLLHEVTQRLYDTLEAVAQNSFGSLRQRVARHLLDLAVTGPTAGLVASVTQQQLADAVGSVRTAVARAIAELRAAGLVATSARGLAILDPERLHDETWSRGL